MRDVSSGSLLAAVAVLYFAAAQRLPAGSDEPGPAFFPLLLAGALFFLGLGIAAAGWLRRESHARPSVRRPAALILCTIGFVPLFAWAGFAGASFLYTLATSAILGQRGARLIVVPIAVTGAIYLALVVGLGVPLP